MPKAAQGLKRNGFFLETDCNNINREIAKIDLRVETMEEYYKNIETLQDREVEIRAERQELHFWQIRRKRWKDNEISRIDRKIRAAKQHFETKYEITFEETPAEIERIQKERCLKKSELEQKEIRMLDTMKEKARVHIQPAAHRTDGHGLSVQIRKPPRKTRDISLQLQAKLNLDTLKKNTIIMRTHS